MEAATRPHRYDSFKAERHYRAVDPENRLVAGTLEHQWEQALRKEQQLREEYDRFLRQTPPGLTLEDEERIRTLAADIPALWASATTTNEQRMEIIRSLIDRVVVSNLDNSEYLDVTLQWVGGFVSQHQILRSLGTYAKLRDYDRMVERIRELRGFGQSASQIAEQLNAEGFHSVRGGSEFKTKLMRQLIPRLGSAADWPTKTCLVLTSGG